MFREPESKLKMRCKHFFKNEAHVQTASQKASERQRAQAMPDKGSACRPRRGAGPAGGSEGRARCIARLRGHVWTRGRSPGERALPEGKHPWQVRWILPVRRGCSIPAGDGSGPPIEHQDGWVADAAAPTAAAGRPPSGSYTRAPAHGSRSAALPPRKLGPRSVQPAPGAEGTSGWCRGQEGVVKAVEPPGKGRNGVRSPAENARSLTCRPHKAGPDCAWGKENAALHPKSPGRHGPSDKPGKSARSMFGRCGGRDPPAAQTVEGRRAARGLLGRCAAVWLQAWHRDLCWIPVWWPFPPVLVPGACAGSRGVCEECAERRLRVRPPPGGEQSPRPRSREGPRRGHWRSPRGARGPRRPFRACSRLWDN